MLEPRSGMDGAIELFSHNDDVRDANDEKIATLPGEAIKFTAKDRLQLSDDDRDNEHLQWLRKRPKGCIVSEKFFPNNIR